MKKLLIISTALTYMLTACHSKLAPVAKDAIKPTIITEQVPNDTDDPAIWINPKDSSQVIVIGTDKHEKTGGLYAFDMDGKIINKVVPLDRPNNVDIAYGFKMGDQTIDIAVLTERGTNKIRVFSLPDLKPLDQGGIPVFEGEQERSPMGIALYTQQDSSAHKIYAVVGRKSGPSERYLFQYELIWNGQAVEAEKVREFGQYVGGKEIEAIAVDNELGYIYYSDEGYGIHKYYANPKKGNEELALFGQKDFKSDHEGIAIYKQTDSTGYILVSNQQNNSFNIYPREGSVENANQHPLLKEIPVSTIECDGADAVSMPIGSKFPKGVLVAMSNGRVFHYYDWQLIENLLSK
ncbi:phytase [Sphingobacterium sp. HJSM2_6]|uniref:phytase n=1 Tax=Sphingobacterium sp. HJSM2_6 TaxID=3366264 RepID=UPI003BD9EF63